MRTATRAVRGFIAVLMVVLALGMLRAAPTHAAGHAGRRRHVHRATPARHSDPQAVSSPIERSPAAVAAVARRGKLVYLEPVGLQSLESKAPMTERSLFRIYSMTKAVTAVAVMMLVEEGKVRLTDPASKFLPEFKNVMVQEGGSGRASQTRRAKSPSRICCCTPRVSATARRSCIDGCRCDRDPSICRSSSSTSRRRR